MSPTKEDFGVKASTWLSTKVVIPIVTGLIGIIAASSFNYIRDNIKDNTTQEYKIQTLVESNNSISRNITEISIKLEKLNEQLVTVVRTSDVRLSLVESEIKEIRRRLDNIESQVSSKSANLVPNK